MFYSVSSFLSLKVITWVAQLYFRRFFPKFEDLFLKKWLPIYDSKFIPLLATTFSMCHRSKQMVVGKCNVWRVRWVRQYLPFQCYQVCLDRSCDMSPTIVMLEDNFAVSLLVLWPFLLQWSAQMYQLHSILIPYDGFTWFLQIIIHHTELVPPNAEHNLDIVNIGSGHRRWCVSGHSP